LRLVLLGRVAELSAVRILDPACGSGNFLYLALRRMLDLWREVYLFSAEHGLPTLLPHQVHPSQLYGLETNVYAHELASVVVWITNLYNARPSWLAEAHRKLDAAMFAAYGWPVTLTDAELLERLLALNHERAAASRANSAQEG
jgi:type II restriction/modification system DNA methylase subunit YeeA